MSETVAEHTGGTFCPKANRHFVLIAAILASAMGFIDGSVVSIAMPSLMADLDARIAQGIWINNGYMLPLSALVLVGGALGDVYGQRRSFIAGIFLFVIASALCAVAPNADLLIAARVVQGIGAAIMVPGSLAILAKAYPKEERGAAIGTWAAASAVTTALGPMVGGLVLQTLGDSAWRLIFAINLPIGAFAVFLLWRLVPDDEADGGRSPDWVGALFISIALLLLAYGLAAPEGEESSVASASQIISFSLPALIAFALFLWWESRAPAPMVPLRLFASSTFSGANILTFSFYFGLSAVLFFLPITMIDAWGVGQLQVALAFLPISVAIGLLSGFVGRLADRVGPAPLLTTGSITVAIAYVGLALAAPMQSFWLSVLPFLSLTAIGLALVVSPLSTAVMTSVDETNTGSASGVNNAVSRVAGLFAVALMGLLAATVYNGSVGVTPGDYGLSSAAENADAHSQAMTAAFQAVALVAAALSFISAAVAWLMIRKPPSS
ncbi:MAG: DHA2 family efflux MFS transporter permease subunit [Pseudomonadota bacterium]